MNTSLINKLAAGICLGGFALVSSATAAISFNVTSLNSNSNPDVPGSYFSVGLAVNSGKATFSVSNLNVSGNATKITDIWLGTTGAANDPNDGFFSFFKQDGALTGTGVYNYSINYNPNSNQGGVPWGVEVTGDPATGNAASTLNPGETLNITFSLVNSLTTEQQLVDGFNANPQQLGIAFHAQSLPGGFSEKYEALPSPSTTTRTPDGGTTLSLMGLALAGLAAGRRFLKK